MVSQICKNLFFNIPVQRAYLANVDLLLQLYSELLPTPCQNEPFYFDGPLGPVELKPIHNELPIARKTCRELNIYGDGWGRF